MFSWMSPCQMRDLLAFFNRSELLDLSLTTHRVRRIIDAEFMRGPFIAFKSLKYSPFNIGPHHLVTMDDRIIKLHLYPEIMQHLLDSKFVRIQEVDITIYSGLPEIDWLEKCGHLWANGRLKIHRPEYSPYVNPTKELALSISQSPDLHVIWKGILRYLNVILTSPNTKTIEIIDSDILDKWDIPKDALLNFLFKRHRKNGPPRNVEIHGFECPEFAKAFEAIKERYFSIFAPAAFTLRWYNHNPDRNRSIVVFETKVIHPHTGDCLQYSRDPDGFTLDCAHAHNWL
ncbi:hypothetical protein DdX_10013 [Ditylenchus destructor]|uniref:Uncharacterized protein n=1 Tax=Ditylenchus destructor TaxID=166010 RepID=A0AAD4QZG9_9BILA|nr:hypothetical protein DdX_10013 [Ditylenchus destructor]